MDIDPGFVVCPKCKGSGLYDNNYKPTTPVFIAYECLYCEGEGQIDWISGIVGKKNQYHIRRLTMGISEYNYRTKGI